MVELRRRVKTPLSTSRFAEVRDDAMSAGGFRWMMLMMTASVRFPSFPFCWIAADGSPTDGRRDATNE